MYTYHKLSRRIRVTGTDCKISGYITFESMYGDTYTVVKDFDYVGKVVLKAPLYSFNELRALIETFPYIAIIAVCLVVLLTLSGWERIRD